VKKEAPDNDRTL